MGMIPEIYGEHVDLEDGSHIDFALDDADKSWHDLSPEERQARLPHAAEVRKQVQRRLARNAPNAHIINTGGDDASVYLGSKSFANVNAAGKWLAERWQQLENRYSRREALAMALAMLATQPQVLPGSLFLIVEAAEDVRRLRGYLRSNFSGWELNNLTTPRKDMSWVDIARGGALVPPPAFGSRIGLRRNSITKQHKNV